MVDYYKDGESQEEFKLNSNVKIADLDIEELWLQDLDLVSVLDIIEEGTDNPKKNLSLANILNKKEDKNAIMESTSS